MKTSLIVLLIAFTFASQAQEIQNKPNTEGSRISVSSFTMSAKPMFYSNYTSDLYDLVERMQKNQLNPAFPVNDHYQTISNIVLFNYCLELGLANKPTRELLIGISYVPGYRGEYDLTKQSSKRVDTLNMQGYSMYVDSFIYSNYHYAESTEDIGLSFTYLFKSDQKKNLSLFAGFGLSVSYSYYWDLSTIATKDSICNFTTDEDPYAFARQYQPDYWMDYTHSDGVIIKEPSWFVRAFVPVGLNWNISKKDDFWKHINVMFLGHLGMEYRKVLNDMTYLKMYWGIGGLGLKYTF